MSEIGFRHPMFLLLAVPWCVFAYMYFFRGWRYRSSAIALSSPGLLPEKVSWRAMTYPYLPLLRFSSVLLLILALAGPGRGITITSINNNGIDIMIAMDVSGSMMGEDFKPKNRLTVAKDNIRDFVSDRKTDRIGMVVFAGEAYLQCPLTVEYGIISDIIEEIDEKTVTENGTAMGDAIALAASRMIESRTASRIILLLTDGMNNTGSMDPETAAGLCRDSGIRIYCVGIGKKGVPVPYPSGIPGFKRYMRSDLDEETLEKVSSITGGRFYNAENSDALRLAIGDINALEKSTVQARTWQEFHDGFSYFLVCAAFLFFIEIILRSAVYRKIP